MPDYSKGKIYKITNDYNDDIYIGSTCESLNIRFYKHRFDSRGDRYKNRPLYKLMNEIGVVRFKIELIENYPCNDKISLTQREGLFIREQGTLNKQIAGQTLKEYRQQNADKINEKHKEYFQKNKEKLQEYYKQYHQQNKEKLIEKRKEYRQRKKLEKRQNLQNPR